MVSAGYEGKFIKSFLRPSKENVRDKHNTSMCYLNAL